MTPVGEPREPEHELVARHLRAGRREVGGGVARVGGGRGEGGAGRRRPALELAAEEEVGELGLPVGQPLRVAALLPVEVVPAHRAELVGVRRHVDHPRLGRPQQGGQQPAGEGEVAEVVGAELHLEAGVGAPQRQGHDAGVVHQHVEPLDGAGRRSRRRPAPTPRSDRSRLTTSGAAPVATAFTDSRAVAAFSALRHASRTRAPAAGQGLGAAKAEAGVGAGDEHRAPGLVGDVGSRPASHAGHPARRGPPALGYGRQAQGRQPELS